MPYNDSGLSVVLVHGGLTDASVWTPVVAQLRAEGVAANAATVRMRDLPGDVDHVARVTGGAAGGVLLVGHGYGGAVVGEAAARADDAVGLVYIAGYALGSGESMLDIARAFPVPELAAALRPPLEPDRPGLDVVLDPVAFPALFAADVPASTAAGLAAAQRPISVACLTGKASVEVWRTLPSWYLVAADDRCVHPEAQRFMARRAGSHMSETAGSHAVPLSQPTAVVDVILTAVSVLR